MEKTHFKQHFIQYLSITTENRVGQCALWVRPVKRIGEYSESDYFYIGYIYDNGKVELVDDSEIYKLQSLNYFIPHNIPKLVHMAKKEVEWCQEVCYDKRNMALHNIPKIDRNKDLVHKRSRNPEKWTWGRLGKLYGIHRQTARDTFYQHVDKYSKSVV